MVRAREDRRGDIAESWVMCVVDLDVSGQKQLCSLVIQPWAI